jgi:hypothetical protein
MANFKMELNNPNFCNEWLMIVCMFNVYAIGVVTVAKVQLYSEQLGILLTLFTRSFNTSNTA